MFTQEVAKKFLGGLLMGIAAGLALMWPESNVLTWLMASVIAVVLFTF